MPGSLLCPCEEVGIVKVCVLSVSPSEAVGISGLSHNTGDELLERLSHTGRNGPNCEIWMVPFGRVAWCLPGKWEGGLGTSQQSRH